MADQEGMRAIGAAIAALALDPCPPDAFHRGDYHRLRVGRFSLNLDIDQVAAMIGGYRDRFSASFEAGRLLAAAMARVHLANGHDVIMPQMMTNVNAGELAAFESAAAAARAEYCHILLTACVESAVDRCMERAKGSDPRLEVISKVIDENGGQEFLRELHSQVTEFTAGRQPHSVIDCERLTVEQTCQAVEAALRPTW